MCICDLCIIITTNWEVYLHIWMVARVGLMRLQQVHPDITHSKRDRTVLHIDSLLWDAHLIPVYSSKKLPLDFHYSYSLDAFEAYYVNKYIDHHANKMIF